MRRNSSQIALAAVSLVCILILAACSTCSPTLRYITISPTSSTISVGTTQQFTAQAYYSDGSIKDGTSLVFWSSSNAAVATIVPGGVATAVGPGTTTISASAAGTAGATATLSVNQLLSIAVTPATATVAAGGTQQYTATGTYKNPDGTTGTTDVTSLVTWSATPATVATISTGGLATGVGSGSATITATLGSVSGTATLTVGAAGPVSLQITPGASTIAIGNAITFLAQEVYSDSTLHVPANPVVWTSGTPATAGLAVLSPNNNENSIASGLTSGTTTITATDGSFTASVTLTVVTGKTHFAYISNTGGGAAAATIQYYSVSTTTTPYLTSQAAVSQTSPPTQTVIHPNGKYMYWTDAAFAVWVATIDSSTGAPTTIASSGQPTSSGANSAITFAAIDPFGRFLYVANDGGTNAVGAGVYGFTIDQTTGLLTPMSGSPFTANLNTPECVIIDHSGSYAYVTNNGTGTNSDTVAAFSIDQSTGALTALATPTYPTGTGPFLGAIDPSNTHLYTANNTAGTVSGFSINASTGALTSLGADFAITGAVSVSNLVVDPSGTHLYVLDNGPVSSTDSNGQVFGFNIGSGGVIGSAISGTPVDTGVVPIGGIVIDPTGTLLAVDNNNPNVLVPPTPGSISMYLIGSGGALAPTSPATVATGTAPLYVTFYNAP